MARAIGINHVALEVGDLEEAVDFYRSVFGFLMRGRAPGMAFLDMGDQFLALAEGREQPPDPVELLRRGDEASVRDLIEAAQRSAGGAIT